MPVNYGALLSTIVDDGCIILEFENGEITILPAFDISADNEVYISSIDMSYEEFVDDDESAIDLSSAFQKRLIEEKLKEKTVKLTPKEKLANYIRSKKQGEF